MRRLLPDVAVIVLGSLIFGVKGWRWAFVACGLAVCTGAVATGVLLARTEQRVRPLPATESRRHNALWLFAAGGNLLGLLIVLIGFMV